MGFLSCLRVCVFKSASPCVAALQSTCTGRSAPCAATPHQTTATRARRLPAARTRQIRAALAPGLPLRSSRLTRRRELFLQCEGTRREQRPRWVRCLRVRGSTRAGGSVVTAERRGTERGPRRSCCRWGTRHSPRTPGDTPARPGHSEQAQQFESLKSIYFEKQLKTFLLSGHVQKCFTIFVVSSDFCKI